MAKSKMLALDVGTSSARICLGAFDGKILEVTERHRFFNAPVETPVSVLWDILGIYQKLEDAIEAVCGEDMPQSIALDAWGTDMVALDRRGELLTNGVSTRDKRFDGLKESFFERMPRHELYQRTGIQFLNWNSVYLLYGMVRDRPWLMDAVHKLLFTPDAFLYLFTGEKICDYTIASTSQMLNPWRRQWDEEVVRAIGIAHETLIEPALGRVVGSTRRAFAGKHLTVYSGCSHDTAAAVAGVPAVERDFVYMICGSWTMVGTETSAPVVHEAAERMGFSNEGGVDGRIRFLRNVMGMWLIQESRREWARQGSSYTFEELARMGETAAPWQSIIDVDDPRLREAGDVPGVVRTLCAERGVYVPQTVGEVVRCIGDSLVLKLRLVKEQIDLCCGRTLEAIYMVAGGSLDRVLCQSVADATGCVVTAGPAEASVYGNCSVQLIQAGLAGNLTETREILRNSASLTRYEPRRIAALEDAYARNRGLFDSTVG